MTEAVTARTRITAGAIAMATTSKGLTANSVAPTTRPAAAAASKPTTAPTSAVRPRSQHFADHLAGGRTQCQSDAELMGLLRHQRRQQAVKADDRDESGERRKKREEEQVRAPGRLLARDLVRHQRDADGPVRIHRTQARVNRSDRVLRRSVRADDDVVDRKLRLIVGTYTSSDGARRSR